MNRLSPSQHTTPAAPQGRRTRAFDRALTLLRLFAEQPQWGVRELSSRLALAPSTVHKLLGELVDVGLLERTTGGRYRLGQRAPLVGSALLEGYEPVSVALPTLEELAVATGETVHLAALDGRCVVYKAKVEGVSAVRVSSRVGKPFPAYATACGKILLAFRPELVADVLAHGLHATTAGTITDAKVLRRELEAIRQNDLATDLEEIEPGTACIAATVRGPGPMLHAISVSGPVGRIEANARAIEACLRPAVERLWQALGR